MGDHAQKMAYFLVRERPLRATRNGHSASLGHAMLKTLLRLQFRIAVHILRASPCCELGERSVMF